MAVGVEAAASGGLGFFHGVVRREVGDFGDKASGAKGLLNVIALEINVGINLVGDAVVALVAFEADVMRGGADPERLGVDRKGRFPDAQVIARSDDGDGLGMSPAVVLLAAEEVKGAHGHGEIGFFGHAFEEAVEDGVSNVGVHFDPAGGGKDFFHGVLGAEDEEIDHIARIAGLVGDAAGDLGEERVVHAGNGGDLFGGVEDGVGIGGKDVYVNGVSAVGGVVRSLVDADEQAPGIGSGEVALVSDQERLRSVGIADAPNDGAAAGVIEGKDAQQVLEPARETAGSGGVLLVGEAHRTAGGKDNAFASLEINSGVHPRGIPSQLDFL